MVADSRQSAREKSSTTPGVSAVVRLREARGVTLSLLGPFEIRRGDGRLLRLPRKAQALVAYLAMQRGRSFSREHLATLLWGNSATEHARQSLRQCLTAVRRALGADACKALVVDTGSVLLGPSDGWAIDVAAFEAACESTSAADLERANALCRDEFLADLHVRAEPFNDW